MKALNYIKILTKVALSLVFSVIIACSEEFSEVINSENSVVPTIPGAPVLNGWQQEKTGIPARKGAASAVYDGYLYIYGGEDAGMVRGDLWRYNIDEGYTEKLNGHSPLTYSGMAAFDGKLYVFGGINAEGDTVKTLKCYYISINRWKDEIPTTGSAPEETAKHSMEVLTDESVIHIFGGTSSGDNDNTLDDHYFLSLEPGSSGGLDWTKVPPGQSEAPQLKGHASVSVDDSFYYFGGLDNNFQATNVLYYNEPEHNLPWKGKWVKKIDTSPYSPPARAFSGMISADSYLYLFGGRGEDSDLGDHWRYDIKTEEWISLSEGPETRYGFAYGEYQGCFLIFGGYSQDEDKYFSDIWIYHPESDPVIK